MNYGRFFEFDFESSKLDEGIAVFNYRWLRDKHPSAGSQTPNHPIYLTFAPEAIVFHLHYVDLKPEGNMIHYHNPILELFLSPNLEISDGLTDTLNESFSNEFPVKSNILLKKIIRESYVHEEEQCSHLSKDSYSSLDIFEIETKEHYEGKGENATHFLRKLILDFLFDFEFTSVFKNLSFYNTISVKLKENFVFNALMNKMRYYYFRMRLVGSELFSILEDNNGTTDNGQADKNLQFLFQLYEAAEHEWVASVTNPKAMDAFHISPWFNECHEELEQVFADQRLQKSEKTINIANQQHQGKNLHLVNLIRDIISPAATPPKESNPRMRFLRNAGISKSDTFKLTVSNLLNVIHKKQNVNSKHSEKGGDNPFGKSVRSHHVSAKEAAKWNVDHYQFPSLLKVWCGDNKTIWMTIILMIVLSFGLFGLFRFLYHKMGVADHIIGWQFVIIFLTGIVLLCLMGAFMRKFRRSTWGVGIMSLAMPRLLAAIVTAWFTLALSEDLFVHFSSVSCKGGEFHTTLSFHPILSVIIILFIVTIFFICYESSTVNPHNRWKHHFTAALFVFCIAYLYALVVGLLVFDFFGKVYIFDSLNCECTPCNCSHSKDMVPMIPIDKIFIIEFSFFATFIGVFLQLMFQGKSITKTE